MTNRLGPVDTIKLDQAFEAVKIALRQFKKTPNSEVGKLVGLSAGKLRALMLVYLRRLEKERNRKVKINGAGSQNSD